MNTFFTFNEILEKTSISKQELLRWMELKLLTPLGKSEENLPFFSSDHILKIEQIRQFTALGYSPNEILKIIRKIGLPSSIKQNKKKPLKDELLTVGILAEQTGISPRTIKHWEEKGIIEPDMRSQGGFRLYNKHFIYFASLIKDLQHFGYSLDEIKKISDHFRDFFTIKEEEQNLEPAFVDEKISEINLEIENLYTKIGYLKEGISRWEELVKKHRKELNTIQNRNRKRIVKKESEDGKHQKEL